MVKKSFNFSKEAITKIKAPKTGRHTYKDSKESKLTLIVSYGGTKTFYLGASIEEKYHRIRIGAFPDLSIPEARAKAAEIKHQIVEGISPIQEKTKLSEELTFKELTEKYANDYAMHNTSGWEYNIKAIKRQASALFDKKISTIQRSDIQEIFNRATHAGKHSANRLIRLLSAVFNKAIEWELLEKNPAIIIKKHKEYSRDVYLTEKEMPAFFNALEEEKNKQIRDFFLLCLFTGARKRNVMSIRWEYINFIDKTWFVPANQSKNGRAYHVHLADEAIEVLERLKEHNDTEWVFPSKNSKSCHLEEPKTAWKRILKRAGIKNLRIHDLRRTLGSWMAKSGESLRVIGKALNHATYKATEIYTILAIDDVRHGVSSTIKTMNLIRMNQIRKKRDDVASQQQNVQTSKNIKKAV